MLAEVTARASALAPIAGTVSAADFLDREQARVGIGRELALRGADGRVAQRRDDQRRLRPHGIFRAVIRPAGAAAGARDEAALARLNRLALAHVDTRDGRQRSRGNPFNSNISTKNVKILKMSCLEAGCGDKSFMGKKFVF